MRGNAAITAFERGVQWHRALQAFLKAGLGGSDWQRDATIFDCSRGIILSIGFKERALCNVAIEMHFKDFGDSFAFSIPVQYVSMFCRVLWLRS